MLAAVILMTAAASAANLFIMLPLYMPNSAFSVRLNLVLSLITPFNLCKGTALSLITYVLDVYKRQILNDPVIKALLDFKKNEDESSYYTAAQGLIKYSAERLTDKNIIREYVLRQMLEHNNLPDITSLRNFLRNDIKSIYNTFFETDWNKLAASKEMCIRDRNYDIFKI